MDILLVENELQLADQVSRALVRAGHSVDRAGDGPEALAAITGKRFDLMLLDVNLPNSDGFEVLNHVRQAGLPMRVLMLTARSEISDGVAGLKGGADDYLTKPFALEELLARIEALGHHDGETPEPMLRVGSLAMDVAKRRLLRGEEKVVLSPREFEVLSVFMREPGRTFSRDEICERIWAREHQYDTRTVEIFIMRLRKKLDRPGTESLIGTVRGVGYVMKVPPAE